MRHCKFVSFTCYAPFVVRYLRKNFIFQLRKGRLHWSSCSGLAYANSDDDYNRQYEVFKRMVPHQVCQYFDSKWHTIRSQWVEGLKQHKMNLLTSTNNRLESISQKIKSVCSRFANLQNFFKDLLTCIDSLRDERDHRTVDIAQKKPLSQFPGNSIEGQYQSVLTPYAAKFVVRCTVDDCSCRFFKSMSLPCRHVMQLRQAVGLGMSVFCPDLCADRWKKDFNINSHQVMNSQLASNATYSVHTLSATSRVIGSTDKYRKAQSISNELCEVISEVPIRLFDERMEVPTATLHARKANRHVSVVP